MTLFVDAPPPGAQVIDTLGEPGRWVYYPWRNYAVRVPPRERLRELRLDRNRHLITRAEQDRLGALCVAVAGLSVGRAVVTTLAHEGIGGELRLADFDVLELSNLNRVTGGLADVGLGKAELAAREVAELDPYVRVTVFDDGVTEANIDAFLDGVDVVIDECDGLDIKVRLREEARRRRLPVVMATSQRGMLDVERFDLGDRPLFHGLLGDVDSAALRGLTTREKVPFVVRLLGSLSDRAAASLVEVDESLSTWPQLASEVALGGALVTNAVRRIALGSELSGRFHADMDALEAVALPTPRVTVGWTPPPRSRDGLRHVVECACSAPSGGNMQPWRFEASGDVLRAQVDPARGSLLDFRGRASALALGAALEAAELGAREAGFAPSAVVHGRSWALTLAPGDPEPGAADLLWARSCNRRTGVSEPVGELHELAALAGAEVYPGVLPALGEALGALDRVRFLSPRLRRELLGELRFAPAPDGIDVEALELDAADRAAIDVLRTGAGMDFLAEEGLGWGLVRGARDAFASSGGALLLRAPSLDDAALVETGRRLMRLWLEATRRGLAIHPYGAPFLFQRLHEAPASLTAFERTALTAAADAFDLERPLLLILRVSRSAPPSVRSLRRPVDDVLTVTRAFAGSPPVPA